MAEENRQVLSRKVTPSSPMVARATRKITAAIRTNSTKSEMSGGGGGSGGERLNPPDFRRKNAVTKSKSNPPNMKTGLESLNSAVLSMVLNAQGGQHVRV